MRPGRAAQDASSHVSPGAAQTGVLGSDERSGQHRTGLRALLARPKRGTSAGVRRFFASESVVGRRLTIGKLAEAIRLDWSRRDRAWTTGWLL